MKIKNTKDPTEFSLLVFFFKSYIKIRLFSTSDWLEEKPLKYRVNNVNHFGGKTLRLQSEVNLLLLLNLTLCETILVEFLKHFQ